MCPRICVLSLSAALETLSDGNLMWRMVITGHNNAISALKRLAAGSQNEFQVMHLPTKPVMAVMNQKMV